MSATTGKFSATMMNLVKVALALFVCSLLVMAALSYHWKELPAYWATQKVVHSHMVEEHDANALQASDEIAKLPDPVKNRRVSSNEELAAAIMPSADRARDLVRHEKAWEARAGDRDEAYVRAEVFGNQTDWVSVREIRVPTLIYVSPADRITPKFRPDEATNADGYPFDPVRHKYDRTVLMQEHYKKGLPMTNVGNIDELIGRFYDNGAYTLGFPLGSYSAVCVGPGQVHDGGILQAWRNGMQVWDSVEGTLDFSSTHTGPKDRGEYRMTIIPDDPSQGRNTATRICQQQGHGALVVQHPLGPLPEGLLQVAQLQGGN